MARSKSTFKPGTSGNKAGKPAGTTYRAKFRAAVNADLPDIIKNLVASAKAGDPPSIKLVLDRLIPPLRPTSDALNIRTAGSLEKQGAAIINAMARGQVTPDAAKTALDAMGVQSRLIEQSEVIQRIEALEALCLPTAKP
jgi:hypothetical protein